MTLLDACEPLFQKICALNRSSKTKGPAQDFPSLRKEVASLISGLRGNLMSEPSLAGQWQKLEMPILFFVDSMISESRLPASAEWNKNRLAYDFKELAGDQKFFDFLDRDLADPDPDATERLGFYFTCVGLGFSGFYSQRPEQLRPRMVEMLRRVDPSVRTESHMKISPEAYENVDTRDLIEPPPLPTGVLVGFFIALCLVFIAVSFHLYQDATLELRQALVDILSHTLDQIKSHIRLVL